jgi:formyl-CoA transferase
MEGIAPSNAYLCNDGNSIIIAGNGDAIFQRYMDTIGRPDLGTDPGLQSNAGRWERRDELDAAIGEWTAQYSREEALKILDTAGVPSGPINTAADICSDEQYAARNMIQQFTVDTGEAEPKQVGFPGIVPVIGGTSLPIRHVGPDLGEHTREVLETLLGKTPEQIDSIVNDTVGGLS